MDQLALSTRPLTLVPITAHQQPSKAQRILLMSQVSSMNDILKFNHVFCQIGSALKARQFSAYSPAYSPAMSGHESKAHLDSGSASNSKSVHTSGQMPV